MVVMFPTSRYKIFARYERRYSGLNKRIVHSEQCLDMPLQRCHIRFSNYISDMGSQAMGKVVRCLIEGVSDPQEVVKCAHSRTKNQHGTDVIRESLRGVLSQVD